MEPEFIQMENAPEPQVRVQQMDDDAVLEITETVIMKRRHSEKDLLRQKTYFEEMISKGQAGLAEVEDKLAQIQNGKAA